MDVQVPVQVQPAPLPPLGKGGGEGVDLRFKFGADGAKQGFFAAADSAGQRDEQLAQTVAEDAIGSDQRAHLRDGGGAAAFKKVEVQADARVRQGSKPPQAFRSVGTAHDDGNGIERALGKAGKNVCADGRSQPAIVRMDNKAHGRRVFRAGKRLHGQNSVVSLSSVSESRKRGLPFSSTKAWWM